MNPETLLSKWWQSDSCKRAYAQAEAKRAERIERMKREVSARRETLKREVEDWSVRQ